MEDKETSFLQDPSIESEENDALFPRSEHEIQGHVPKQVHQSYFVKLWPTDPDSISRIREAEKVIEEMNQEHRQIIENIKEKMSKRDHLSYMLKNADYFYEGYRTSMASRGSILNHLYVVLDELCFANNAPRRVSKKSCFKGELDNHKLNFLMLHGTKSMAEEKQVLKEKNMGEQRDVTPFSSLDQLRNSINWSYYTNHCQKLLTEIEQFQLRGETAAGNAAVKGKISNYVSLKKAIKDQIKLMCDDTLGHRKEMMAHRAKVRYIEKELAAIDKAIPSLQKKLAEKYQRKAEAYQSILELKKVYDGEISHYYQYRSVINNVYQLAERKHTAVLDELSFLEGSKFMLEWNNNKAFREDYEKRVLHSLERRQLSRDGRRTYQTPKEGH